MPGSEAEAAGLLDAYLSAQHERAEEVARAVGGGNGLGPEWIQPGKPVQ
jgi:hypothetical protein